MEAILVPISFFVFLGAAIIVPAWFKERRKEKTLETVRTVVSQGGNLPPELWEALAPEKPINSPDKDLRRAVLLIGLALGISAIGLSQFMTHGLRVLAGCLSGAAIPGFIGLAYLLLWRLGRTPKP